MFTMNEGPIMRQVTLHITLASWTQILLYVEMLKFLPQKMFFQEKHFVRKIKNHLQYSIF
jgi:hypothetical protein